MRQGRGGEGEERKGGEGDSEVKEKISSRRKVYKNVLDGNVDASDIGCSDHFLVWMDLGRACKLTKSRRRIIKKWC